MSDKKYLKKYSKTQSQAIEAFGAEVYVSAGAGSGKTTVLVERFLLAALRNDMGPEKILAITFTEKAANEMKVRLVAECDKRGMSAFRRQLENSYVNTFHGFCSR